MSRINAFLVAAAAAMVFSAPVLAGDGGSVELSAECHWYGSAECHVACQDFTFYASCEAEVNASVEGQCDGLDIDIECQGSCEADCQELDCDVDLGEFDCEAHCSGECGASCQGECATTSDSAYCQGECEAFCQGECSGGCQGTPPDVDCEGGCQASCEGSCQAEADFDCHMEAEIDAYIDCEADMQVDCDAACDTEGVFECNGDFIDKGDIEDAIAWLEEHGITVTYEGSADCEGNECHAEGSASISCAAAEPVGQERAEGEGTWARQASPLLRLILSLF